MTIGGDRSGSAAGDYTASFTPTPNYQWWDGTTGAKSATWSIASIIVPIPRQKNLPTYIIQIQRQGYLVTEPSTP